MCICVPPPKASWGASLFCEIDCKVTTKYGNSQTFCLDRKNAQKPNFLYFSKRKEMPQKALCKHLANLQSPDTQRLYIFAL